MFFDDDDYLTFEEGENCHTCAFRENEKKQCPMVALLAYQMLDFQEYIFMADCAFYEKEERHLKIVK